MQWWSFEILLEIVSPTSDIRPVLSKNNPFEFPLFSGGSCSVALKGPRDDHHPSIVVCTLQDSFRITLWDPLSQRVLSANVNMISIDSKSPTRPSTGKKTKFHAISTHQIWSGTFQGILYSIQSLTQDVCTVLVPLVLSGEQSTTKSKNKPNLELRVHRLTGDCVLKDDDERITLNKERLLEIHNNKEQDTWSNLIRGSTMDEREAISIKECNG